MSEDTRPIGLRGDMGCHVLDRILQDVQISDDFEFMMSSMWSQNSGASGPGQYEMMRDEKKVVAFMRKHIFPVIDPNNEAECYFLLNAIKHIHKSSFYERSHLTEGELEKLDGGSSVYSDNRRVILLDFLREPKFEGTVMQQYLQYPIDCGDRSNQNLFSIEGSQASRKWSRTADVSASPQEMTF